MTPKVQSMIQDWDKDIQNWINGHPSNHPVISGRMKDFAPFVSAGNLSGDYLPEPYYGDPDNCSTVVLNINPGSSCPNEDTKNITNRADPTNGTIIYDFENKFNRVYSAFQKVYSPFAAPNWVPGVNWWKDNRNDYINNIVRLYCNLKGKSLPDSMPTPFAFELCPLHSKDTTKLNFTKKVFLPVYRDNIFSPATDILARSVIPFGLGFSSTVNSVMTDKKLGAYEQVEIWSAGKDSKGKAVPNWPLNSKGMPKKRTYVLLKGISPETSGSYFLNTWDNSGHLIYITRNMMSEYKDVDGYIVKEIVQTFGL